MKIDLPNGALKSRRMPGGDCCVYLHGDILCVRCLEIYNVEMVIDPTRPGTGEKSAYIKCPACEANILNVGGMSKTTTKLRAAPEDGLVDLGKALSIERKTKKKRGKK